MIVSQNYFIKIVIANFIINYECQKQRDDCLKNFTLIIPTSTTIFKTINYQMFDIFMSL